MNRKRRRYEMLIGIGLIGMMLGLVQCGTSSREFEEKIEEETIPEESPEEVRKNREVLLPEATANAEYLVYKIQQICDKQSDYQVTATYKACTEQEFYNLDESDENEPNYHFYYMVSFHASNMDAYYEKHRREELEQMYGEEPLKRLVRALLDEFGGTMEEEITVNDLTGMVCMRFVDSYYRFSVQSEGGHQYSTNPLREHAVVRKDGVPICGQVEDPVEKYQKEQATGGKPDRDWNDPYDVQEYADGDEFAEEWAEEFADSYNGDEDDGYEDAYEYWENEQ